VILDLIASIDVVAGVAALAVSLRTSRQIAGIAAHLGVRVSPSGQITAVVEPEPGA